ncbi:efflux RND transporter periplasmic adaptor subunit [candidate division KSB1 bacterium]
MKSKLLIVSVVFLLMACSQPEVYQRTEIEVPVKIEEITLKTIEEFEVATGTVNASVDVIVKSEIQGHYNLLVNPETSKPFAIGDRIKKDQKIIRLENSEQEFNIRIESHELNLNNAKENLTQQKMLYEKGGASLTELKNAEKSLDDAQYNYDRALMDLERFNVKSPFDGIIVDMPYYTSDLMVAANSDMFHIMDYATLKMEINLPGKLLGVVTEGQSVRVGCYMLENVKLNARITQVAPVLEPNTRTFKATLNIDNKDLLVRPGMFVQTEIITTRKENAIVIPKDIIMIRRNVKTVFVVTEGVARQRNIITGIENPEVVEVIDGLEENDFLIIEGFETLRNGSKVTISTK